MPVAFLLGRCRKPIPFAFKLVLNVNVLKKMKEVIQSQRDIVSNHNLISIEFWACYLSSKLEAFLSYIQNGANYIS